MRTEGRTAIITGASSGIGRETALEFARNKANVVLAARNREKLDDLAREIAPLPGRCLVVPTDVTDRFAVEALVRRTAEEYGSVDILVNNAGLGLFATVAEGNIENMHRLFNVNFWGAIHCIQATVPYMQAQRRGHIVNVSSVAGRIAPPYMGTYAATKFALTAISDSLRTELAGSGIGVSTVFPGLTQTSFTENMLQEVDVPPVPPLLLWVDARTVARRIVQAVRWGLRDVYVSPQDAAAVAFSTIAPQLSDWMMRAFARLAVREPGTFSLPPGPRTAQPSPADPEPESESA